MVAIVVNAGYSLDVSRATPAATITARGFLCYARADRRLVDRFRRLLAPRLAIVQDLDVSIWWDEHILVGGLWDDEIRRAIDEADFGLLLVSPALLSREYIRRVEIPALLASPGTKILPVGLRRVDFARSDLRGLDARQIFLWRDAKGESRWFAGLAGENPERFCDALVAQIADLLLGSQP